MHLRREGGREGGTADTDIGSLHLPLVSQVSFVIDKTVTLMHFSVILFLLPCPVEERTKEI